jgi:hypothetical protein
VKVIVVPAHEQLDDPVQVRDYDCYCYLPLDIICGRHLLAAQLRRSNADAADAAVEEVARIVAQIRRRRP